MVPFPLSNITVKGGDDRPSQNHVKGWFDRCTYEPGSKYAVPVKNTRKLELIPWFWWDN